MWDNSGRMLRCPMCGVSIAYNTVGYGTCGCGNWLHVQDPDSSMDITLRVEHVDAESHLEVH